MADVPVPVADAIAKMQSASEAFKEESEEAIAARKAADEAGQAAQVLDDQAVIQADEAHAPNLERAKVIDEQIQAIRAYYIGQ